MIDARPQTRTAPDEQRKCGNQPAHQSLITDVFRPRPLFCTIHNLINFTLRAWRTSQLCPQCLTKDIREIADDLLQRPCRRSRVESRCDAVAVGRTYLFPPL